MRRTSRKMLFLLAEAQCRDGLVHHREAAKTRDCRRQTQKEVLRIGNPREGDLGARVARALPCVKSVANHSLALAGVEPIKSLGQRPTPAPLPVVL